MREVAESEAKQFNEFFNDCLKEKKTSIYEIIKKNKFAIFNQRYKGSNMDITILKKTCQLFSQLYIACQNRDGNLDEFFLQESGSYPPSTFKNCDLIPGSKSGLLHCLKKFNKEAATDNMAMDYTR